METTFENAKVGDRVYSLIHGWGEIISTKCIVPFDSGKFPIQVIFEDGNSFVFTTDGFVKFGPENRTLFWDKPEIIAPERPKRKVKKSEKFDLLIWKGMTSGQYSVTGNQGINPYFEASYLAGKIENCTLEWEETE